MVILCDPTAPDCWMSLHPLQMKVQQTQGCPCSPILIGYALFANLINSADPNMECPYQLSTLSCKTNHWSKVNQPFPNGYLPSTYLNPCLDILVTLGFISNQENVDRWTVEDAVHVWHAPSSQQV